MYAVYFGILAGLWALVWWAFFVLFTEPHRLRTFCWHPRHRRLLLLAGVLTIPCSYLAAYPPAVRAAQKQPSAVPLLDLFVPAEWIIDHTPADAVVLQVADWWGVRTRIEADRSRRHERQAWGQWPWLAALAGTVAVAICAIVPPLVAARVADHRWRRVRKANAVGVGCDAGHRGGSTSDTD